jgi:hypothetical protein
MDPVPFFIIGLMVGSVGILLGQAFARRRITRASTERRSEQAIARLR